MERFAVGESLDLGPIINTPTDSVLSFHVFRTDSGAVLVRPIIIQLPSTSRAQEAATGFW